MGFVQVLLLFFEIIGIIIIAFSTLLYDEIIIIKKWGLDLNVRKEIISRGKEDVEKTIELEINRDSTFEEVLNQDDDNDNHDGDNLDNDIKENPQNNSVDNGVEEN